MKAGIKDVVFDRGGYIYHVPCQSGWRTPRAKAA
ncbi:MAG: hypothetical protein WDN31_07580 [Hyphomicrobium sp.]